MKIFSTRRKSGCTGNLLMPGLILGLVLASFVSLYVSRLYFAIDSTNAVRQALLRYSIETYDIASESNRHTQSGSGNTVLRAVETNLNKEEAVVVASADTPSETKEQLIARIFPNETQIENPPLQDGTTTFAACMLVMDDNHRLTEWMAYHYHVLPLRYMIVAVDPRSKTSPTHILNQWRKRGVHIIEWNDRDFWRADLKLKPIPDDAELQTKRDRHRGRQKYFYKQCLIRAKQDKRTWVSLHDSDEFLVYNHAGGEKFAEWEKRRSKTSRMPRMKPSQTPPTTAEAGAMIRYINQERAAGLKYYQSPCIGIPRTMFGADESQVDHAAVVKNTPAKFKWAAPLMDTMRYRQHATRNDFVKNALGKVIIDVSRVNVAKTPYFMSLHRPIKKLCPTPWVNDWSAGLRINHYLGSWHSYSFRDDSRRGNERSWEQWNYKAMTLGENTDDNIRPWVSGLVETEGEDVALDMLQNVGLPANYKNGDDYKWHLVPERLNEILSTDITIKQDNKAVAFEDWVRQTYRKNPEMVEQRKRDYARIQAELAAAAAGEVGTTQTTTAAITSTSSATSGNVENEEESSDEEGDGDDTPTQDEGEKLEDVQNNESEGDDGEPKSQNDTNAVDQDVQHDVELDETTDDENGNDNEKVEQLDAQDSNNAGNVEDTASLKNDDEEEVDDESQNSDSEIKNQDHEDVSVKL